MHDFLSGKALQFSRKEIKESFVYFTDFPCFEEIVNDLWADHEVNVIYCMFCFFPHPG